jgi:hypothetical protein
LISNGGGSMPVRSRNGRELFYRSRIMVVGYTIEADSFVAGKPRIWSEATLANTGLTPNFDLTPDGTRGVVLIPTAGSAPRDATSDAVLVMNLVSELRRTAPAQMSEDRLQTSLDGGRRPPI